MGECGCVQGPDFVFKRGKTQALGIEPNAGCSDCDAGPGVIIYEACGEDGVELMDHCHVVPASTDGLKMWGIEFISRDGLLKAIMAELKTDPHVYVGMSASETWDELCAEALAEGLRDVILDAMDAQIHQEIAKRQAEQGEGAAVKAAKEA